MSFNPFSKRDTENLREHYALTMQGWVRRLKVHHAEAAALVTESVYRTWRVFLRFSAVGFERAQLSVYQSLLAKPLAGKLPLSMNRARLYSK